MAAVSFNPFLSPCTSFSIFSRIDSMQRRSTLGSIRRSIFGSSKADKAREAYEPAPNNSNPFRRYTPPRRPGQQPLISYSIRALTLIQTPICSQRVMRHQSTLQHPPRAHHRLRATRRPAPALRQVTHLPMIASPSCAPSTPSS